MIKEKPELIQKVVSAALRGMKDIMDNPDATAAEFVNFVPTWKGKEAAIKWTFEYYAKYVYPGQKKLGEVSAERLAKLEDFYVSKGLITSKVPVDELYTNQFIK
jgi:NitT/TauT family transport system substrate-binding protein